MIHLTWDWTVFSGVLISGLLTGFVLGPQSWPLRAAEHIRPPVALAFVMGLSVGAAFFVPLAVFRIVAGLTAELQATVLYVVFCCTGSLGLALRAWRTR